LKPKPSPIPVNYPSWASWKSKEVYLPAEFHSSRSFKSALAIAADAFSGQSSVFEDMSMDAPLLLVGLMFREISRAIEVEEGEDSKEDSKLPKQLVNSSLGVREMDKIEEMLEAISLPQA
jgi:hypothetical protein